MARYLVFEFPNENDDELIDIWLAAYNKDIALVAFQSTRYCSLGYRQSYCATRYGE